MALRDYASHFSRANIPFGIASSEHYSQAQCVTRIGNDVIFLAPLQQLGMFKDVTNLPERIFLQSSLNGFAALGKETHKAVRSIIQQIHDNGTPPECVELVDNVNMFLPVQIGDFVDFSCSLDHVQNAGRISTGNPTPPRGFFHFPPCYSGKASSVVVSGTSIKRPLGHIFDKKDATSKPTELEIIFAPSKQMDFEMEFAAVIGKPLPLQQGLNAIDADEHIFGFVLLDDWSARDIQWVEMQPLGPCLSKNVGTTISPWIVTTEALQSFKVKGKDKQSAVQQHLHDNANMTYDIQMHVEIETGNQSTVIGSSNTHVLYWTVRQMLAHIASTGSPLRTGDIMATGTISGSSKSELGCLLEVTDGGRLPVRLNDGNVRTFLEDGDIVRVSATAGSGDQGVGFGECIGKLIPSRAF